MTSTSQTKGIPQITVDREALLEGLQAASRIASSRTSIQALTGVQLAAGSGGIELRATDLELSVRLPLEGQVQTAGEVVLPARLFADVVRSLPGGTVSIVGRGATQDVEITAGSATFDLKTLRAEDFPTLPASGGNSAVTIPAAALESTVKRVEKAASTDQTRPVLTGVLFQVEGKVLRMVATDSYRLSFKETELEKEIPEGFDANVPARALQEAVRLSQGSEQGVLISLQETQVVFDFGGIVLASRLIDGQFPKYRELLPEKFEHELRISSEELGGVIRRISLLAQRTKPLTLSFTKGTLTVSAQTPDIGEATETLPVPFDGEDLDIGFNPDYLRDGIESAGEGDLILKLISSLRPGLIESGDGSGFMYLIMPIRLNA
jgi:DNA polymerase-3 subunit beta